MSSQVRFLAPDDCPATRAAHTLLLHLVRRDRGRRSERPAALLVRAGSCHGSTPRTRMYPRTSMMASIGMCTAPAHQQSARKASLVCMCIACVRAGRHGAQPFPSAARPGGDRERRQPGGALAQQWLPLPRELRQGARAQHSRARASVARASANPCISGPCRSQGWL